MLPHVPSDFHVLSHISSLYILTLAPNMFTITVHNRIIYKMSRENVWNRKVRRDFAVSRELAANAKA